MNKLSAYILLDRSGSMISRWEQAIASINEYVKTLAENADMEAEVAVIAVDSNSSANAWVSASPGKWNSAINLGLQSPQNNMDFHLLRPLANVKDFMYLTYREIEPRGGTPLYDGTARLLDLAEANNNDKTVILIMTDGADNTSVEYNQTTIKARIDRCNDRKWEVVFLGADFNTDQTAGSYGLSMTKSFSSSAANLSRSMTQYAMASAAYTTVGTAIDTTNFKE